MSPAKKLKKVYTGPDRRAPRPPPSATKSVIGVMSMFGGFAVWVFFHYRGIEAAETVPMLMIGFGGFMVDRDTPKALRNLLPWKRNGNTSEYEAKR